MSYCLLNSYYRSSFLASRGSPPGTWVGKGPGRNYGSVAALLQPQALCLGVQVTEELPLLPRLKILSFRGGGQQCHGQRLSRSGEATLLTCLQYLCCTAPFGNEGLGVARSMAWSFEFVLNLLCMGIAYGVAALDLYLPCALYPSARG